MRLDRADKAILKTLRYLNLIPRDVAQLVARLLWEQDVAGSNPVIPTILVLYAQKNSHFRKILAVFLFILYIGCFVQNRIFFIKNGPRSMPPVLRAFQAVLLCFQW